MLKKLIAIILALTVAVLSIPFSAIEVNAAYSDSGTVVNPGFEDASKTSADSSDGVWKLYNTNLLNDVANIHSGSSAVEVSTGDTATEQTVNGLKPNTKYFFTIWAKTTNPAAPIYIGVKNYGGAEVKQQVTSTVYTQYSIEYTTGGANTSALIYIWGAPDGDTGKVYADDAAISTRSYINNVTAGKDQAEVAFDDILSSAPVKEDFDISYISDADPGTKVPVTVSNFAYDSTAGNKHATIDYTTIGAIAVAQNITMDIKYKCPDLQYETYTKTFTVEADGSPVIDTEIDSVAGTNGKLEILLKNAPTIVPKAADFTAKCSINTGEYTTLALSNFAYDKLNKKVSFTYNPIIRGASDQTVSIKVSYSGIEKETTFTLLAAKGVTYYVDSISGNDSNDGTSEANAWKSIEKVNNTTFQPGDRILFKSGCSWTGELWPKGSGADSLPIVIDKYGTGSKPLFSGNGGTNTFKLFNQSFWEVNNLELTDSAAEAGTRRAVLVEAQDIGLSKHIYLRNLDIHDVTGDDKEKRSGGIIILVTGSKTPTIYDDVRIENNYIRRVNRTGIKAVRSVWDMRDSWKASDSIGDWKGSTNLVIKNNYIENVGGDGMLIRDSIKPLVEHNVVRSAQETSPYAVGMFNWNTDDCIFQYNEAYDTKQTADGMGYDIDALNKNTIMQYNYSHDNEGGFVMICSTSELHTTDSIIRYNISQNDRNRIFETRPGSDRTVAYNNTIFTGAGLGTPPKYMCADSDPGGSIAFYNNIYVNEGTASEGPWNEEKAGATYDRNLFYGNFLTYPNDASILKTNPMLVAPGTAGAGINSAGGYRLKAGSPCIDAGKTIANNGGKDYWGNALSDGKTDIGAHEYSGEATATPDYSENKVTNGDFESGTRYGWTPANTVTFNDPNKNKGSYCAKITSNGSSIEQLVRELYPTSKYEFKIWAKLDNSADKAYVGVKDASGAEIAKVQVDSTSYKEYSIPFTAASAQTSAIVFVKMESGTGSVYADDALLTENLIGKTNVFDLKAAIRVATEKLGSVAPGITPGYCSQSVYDELVSRMAEADSALVKVGATQADIDAATANLNTAVKNIEAGMVPVKAGDLASAITAADLKCKAATEGYDIGQYANGSKNLLGDAITKAKAVSGDLKAEKTSLVALSRAVYIFENSIITGKKITGAMTAAADSAETAQQDNSPQRAVDGDAATIWHTDWNTGTVLPHWITIDLKSVKKVAQYSYLPRQDKWIAGIVKKYQLYASTDNSNFSLVSSGIWSGDKSEKLISFNSVDARYLKLVILDAEGGYGSAAEIGVYEETINSVAAGVKSIPAPKAGDTEIKLPAVPTGHSIAIKSTSPNGIIAADGKITFPRYDTIVNVVLKVTRTSDNASADTREIGVLVPGTEIPKNVADSITSINSPAVGDAQLKLPVVPNGFIANIKSVNPAGIVALDGSITAPRDNTTVTVVLTVTKVSDKTSADTKPINVTIPGFSSQIGVTAVFRANTDIVTTLAGNTGKYINAFVTADNKWKNDIDAVIIVAAYDKDGAFITSAAEHKIVKAGDKSDLEAGMLAVPNIARIKVFVMSVNKGEEYRGVYPQMTYLPLCEGIELK